MTQPSGSDASSGEGAREEGNPERGRLGSEVDADVVDDVDPDDPLGGLDIESTADIEIPDRLVDQVIGQDHARDVVLKAAEQRRGERSGEARERLGAVLDRKREAGIYQTLAHTDQIDDPTFFHGTAGIGYSMLRVIAPEDLPSVLLWE